MSQTTTNTQQSNPYGHSKKFLRMRKLFLFFPLMAVLPILVGFMALGGGKGQPEETTSSTPAGLNTNLPAPHFDKQKAVENKLTYYEKADNDSIKFMTQARQDPYRAKKAFLPDRTATSFRSSPLSSNSQNAIKPMPLSPGDTMADELTRRINILRASLASKQTDLPPATPKVSRIATLLQSMHSADTAKAAADPQMDRIDAMLDKIMRIEHPQPSIHRDTLASPKRPVSLVRPAQPDDAIETLQITQADDRVSDSSQSADTGGFYSIDDPLPADTLTPNTILAVVHGDQTLVTGSTIELFLMDEAVISGQSIPRDYPLYGQATLNGDRLLVSIHSIRSGASIYPVSLEVYDLDGLPGIRIPGNLTSEVTKQSAGQGIDAIGLTTLDPSIGAQATQAGIQAAKTLMSKKVRLTPVSIPSGYQVLLKNISPNQR